MYHTEPHGALRLIEMELVEGPSLSQVVDSLDDRARLRLFGVVCAAVTAAHEAGVLHLDLKPSNILLRPSGEPVVTDFGLSLSVANDESATARGGTLRYMAPEQRDGRPVNERTDIYALGVMLRELLPGASRSLRRVVVRATAELPGRRYPDVQSLLRDLDRPVRLRRAALRGSMVIVPVAVVGVGLFVARPAKTGDVLVLGGFAPDRRWHSSAQVFDAAAWRWRTVEPVPDPGRSVPRTCGMRAIRSGDDVLVLGGGAADTCWAEGATTNRVRVWSLASASWSLPECQAPCIEHDGVTFWLDRSERDQRRRWKKGNCSPEGPCMLYGRNSFLALAFPNDDVFVYGGCCSSPNDLDQFNDRPTPMFRMAELYRRATRTWQPVAPSLLSRSGASGVTVGGGNGVLVCGGYDDRTPQPYDQHDTCEVFSRNKDSGAWRPAGRMPATRTVEALKMAALRQDVVLGLQPGHAWLWRGKDWWADPGEWRWDDSFFESIPLPVRGQHLGTLTRLKDGRALLVGGNESDRIVPSAQLFALGPDDKGGSWREAAPMREARRDHAAVLLQDGRVLVAGGCAPEPLSSAEVYDPAQDRWTDAGNMSAARCSPQAVALR